MQQASKSLKDARGNACVMCKGFQIGLQLFNSNGASNNCIENF